MLDREHLAGACNTTLHFVGDEHDAVLVAHPAQRAQEIERRHVESALALHGLDHDGRDRFGIDVAVEQPLQIRERLFGGHAAIGQRKFGVIDLGRERPKAALVGHHLAGERHGHQGAPVEAAGEGDDRRALGVISRDLDGILERLGSG